MDADGTLGSKVATGIVAVAVGSMMPQQDAVLRGSMAAQSLAADLAADVFQSSVPEGNVEVVQNSEVVGSLGNKALEVMIVQTIAATIPTMVNKILNSCGTRRTPQGPKNNSPEVFPIPIHRRPRQPRAARGSRNDQHG